MPLVMGSLIRGRLAGLDDHTLPRELTTMAEPIARHSVSVAAAIVNEAGNVLAIRRHDNGHWEPPGGVLELDESIHEGLIREVEEETGLVVEPERLTGVYKNMKHSIIALVFRCHVVSGRAQTGPEVAEIRWLPTNEIVELMREAYAIRLLDALQLGPPALRSHDGVVLVSPGESLQAPA
jgi:8-oxo-dGTP diphosphatase